MAPKKAAAEMRTSLNKEDEKEVKGAQKAGGSEEASKAVRKASPRPSTMDMVKNALTELDQRKGVSAQAIRTFIKEKYTTVDEARLKTMVRKALVKGIDSGTFVRPANSSTTTGAQGRFRLAVRKPKLAKNKGAKENTSPNISQAKEPEAKTGDVKTKKTKSAAVEGDEPKKTKKNDALASKVAPAKKPKSKRPAGAAEEEPGAKTQKTSKASKGEGGEKSSTKKGGKKAARKAEEGPDEGEAGLLKKETQKSEQGGTVAEATVQKKGGRKAARKADDGEQNGTRSSGKKGKKAAEK